MKKMYKRKVPPESWMTNKKAEFEEEEERRNPPKSVYMGVFNFETDLTALTCTDVHSGSIHCKMVPLDFPNNLISGFAYEFAVLGSKFYIIGGLHYSDILDTVYFFDLLQNPPSLQIAAPMLQPRTPSVVFTYKNNIYVFGSQDEALTPLTRETYAEYYYPVSDEWSYLTAYPPQDILQPVSSYSLSYTLNQEAGVLYIWVAYSKIYQYNLEAKTWGRWLPFNGIYPLNPTTCFDRSINVLCFRNFLIWHDHIYIYAYRLSDARLFHPFQFSNSFEEDGTDSVWWEGITMGSFLLDVGNSKLCLIHKYRNYDQATEDIKCRVFSVKFSGTPPDDVQFELQLENSKDLGVVDSHISTLLAVDSTRIA